MRCACAVPTIVLDSAYCLLVGCWLVKGGRSVNLVHARRPRR